MAVAKSAPEQRATGQLDPEPRWMNETASTLTPAPSAALGRRGGAGRDLDTRGTDPPAHEIIVPGKELPLNHEAA